MEAAKAEAEEIAAASEGKAYVVCLLKSEADAKVVEAACNIVSAKLPEAAVLILGAGKTACALGVVPKGLAEKVCAAPSCPASSLGLNEGEESDCGQTKLLRGSARSASRLPVMPVLPT